MNREQTREAIKVMQHFADGGEVECKQCDGSWGRLMDPNWQFSSCEYRIKPKPLECWVNVYQHDQLVIHPSQDEAREHASPCATRACVHMREVTE